MTPSLHRLGSALFAAVALVLAACGDSDPAPAANGTTYAVGGSVSGLPSGGELKLLNNGGDELTITQDGSFAFATKLASMAPYAVTVGTQPTNAICTVASGSGSVTGSDVTSVRVTCASTFTVGGTVTGLATGNSVALGGAAAGNAVVSADGTFTLPTRLVGGDAYAVTVTTQPTGQQCTVTGGAGTIGTAAVSNVAVNCTYTTQWAYVLNHGSDTISPLAIDATTLAITATTPAVAAQDGPRSITTDAAGTRAVVANNMAKTISVYTINGVTGALTPVGSPVATADLHPRSVALSGNLVFVAVTEFVNINKLLTYRIDAAAGTVTLTDTRDLPSTGYASAVDINPQGTLVMATVLGPGTLSMYTINHATSSLVEVAGSPTSVGPSPRAAKFSPSGTLALVTESDAVRMYDVAAGGALTEKAGSPFATGGATATGLAIDATSTYVYVTNTASNNVTAFALDTAAGTLTPTAGSPFATGLGPEAVGVDRSGFLVFVSNVTDGTVSAFRVGTTGGLSAATGSPFTTGIEPGGIGFGP